MPAKCENLECTKYPSFNTLGETKGKYCVAHKLPDMVDVRHKKCSHPGCDSLPTYNIIGETKAKFCLAHKLPEMVNKKNKRCEYAYCNLRAAYNIVGETKGKYCATHKQPEMLDVKHKRCVYPGCNLQPSYNTTEKSKALYCITHKLTEMINVKNKKCAQFSCDLHPTYNTIGETKGKYCSKHKLPNMVNIVSKKCYHPGCNSIPSYNTIGETKAKYCVIHKLPEMVNIKKLRCYYPDCDTQPSYNTIGESKPKFCLEHKQQGMVNVISKKCYHIGCVSQPIYNTIGETIPKFCTTHKKLGMVDIKNKLCCYQGCKTRAKYGKPGIKPTHCAKHKIIGMIFRPTTRCKDCNELAIYGIKQTLLHCEAHKQPNELNLSERECVSCHLIYILDADNKCENCNPESFARAVLAKQTALMAYLDAHGHPGTTVDDSMIDNGICGKERPDRIIDLHDKVLVIECDENQHRDRQCLCEQTRMVNIGQSFGGIPVYFIRWNPDTFKTPKHRQEGLNKRYDILSDFLNSIKDGRHQLPKNGLVSVIYMFYDGWSGVENLAPENWTVIGASFSITTSS